MDVSSRFRLLHGETEAFREMPQPGRLRLNRKGFALAEGVGKKTAVYPHMRLAAHPSPHIGDLFSPLFGRVAEVNDRFLILEAMEPDYDARQEAAPDVTKTDLLASGAQGEELFSMLKSLGVDTRPLRQQCETLIINGLNPEPGITWAEPMLTTHGEELEAGIGALRRLVPARETLLALPEGMEARPAGLEVVHVPELYPASINALVVKAVTGRENPQDVGIVALHDLWALARVAHTGLPLVETVLTVWSPGKVGNYMVKDGSAIADLLEFCGIELESGDMLIRGGPMRGESLDRAAHCVSKGTFGVFVLKGGESPPLEGNAPCISCGACIRACPARLDPSVMSRNAEFALHERNYAEHMECCLDCGMCGYVCVARRPVPQYIRQSRRVLGLDAHASDPAKRLREITSAEAREPEKGNT